MVTFTSAVVPNMSSGLQPAIPLVVGNVASGLGRVSATSLSAEAEELS